MFRSLYRVACAGVVALAITPLAAQARLSQAAAHRQQTLAEGNAQYAHVHSHAKDTMATVQETIDAVVGDGGYTPSATPLLLLSPEISVWSFDDNLFTENTKHWAGQNMTMVGAISVDGKAYQFMGNSAEFASANALQQQQKIVMPTSTYYQFVTPEKIELIVVFTSIVDQVNNEAELQRPYAYVTVSVNNSDSVNHEVKVYYEVLSDWVLDVNFDNDGQIGWAPLTGADPAHWVANVIRNYDDVPFSEKGDYIKMNWGLMFMATLPDNRVSHTVSSASAARTSFALNASLPGDDLTGVRDYPSDTVGSAFVWSFGELAPQATTGSYMVIGYDDIFSMDYFGEWQRPLWTKQWNGDLHAMILDGINSWQALLARTSLFDRILFAQLRTAGGDAYSLITALAYRQVTAGIKGVWSDVKNESRWYMKEISSDGDISTVDVIYPASPFFIQFAPEILRKMLLPLLDYAINATDIAYNLPWAPHHLGFWPVCDITPGQQEQMPMEESGNFFLMVAGIVQQQKSTVWLQPYWSVMATWSEYLISALPDPGNQLCTDDFEGPSPHNVNLALKGIVGLNAYAQILAADGQQAASAKAAAAAAGFAQQWLKMAQDPNGGNHTLLQFNEPGTFSMKYNMLFDQILRLNTFPPSVMAQEITYYQTQLKPFGLPLDSRGPLTKSDWTSWIAAMSPDPAFANALFLYILKFVLTSPSRGVPFSDWYAADDGHVLGFRARPVQGGLFAKYLLSEQAKQLEAETKEEILISEF